MKGVLIGGHPRSGSGLLSLLLDAHPEIFSSSATHLLCHPGLWREQPGIVRTLETVLAGRGEANLSEGVLPWARAQRAAVTYCLRSAGELVHAAKVVESPGELTDFLFAPRRTVDRKTMWVETATLNLCALSDYLERSPDNRAIVMTRHPRGILWALLRQSLAPLTAVARWRVDAEMILDLLSNPGFEGRVMVVRFEDLVRSPTATLRRVLELVGVDPEIDLIARRSDSRRLDADRSLDPVPGSLASTWMHHPAEPIRAEAADGHEGKVSDRYVRALAHAFLAPGHLDGLGILGAQRLRRDGATVAEALGYPLSERERAAPQLTEADQRIDTDAHSRWLRAGLDLELDPIPSRPATSPAASASAPRPQREPEEGVPPEPAAGTRRIRALLRALAGPIRAMLGRPP